jgi:G2/mitotic-specific cyclin 3/4
MKMLPNPHYMDIQTEIQWSMRSILMDWLVQVHHRFSLLPETLFLTVNYIDRFLSYKIVSIPKLQLVGATAILVASKYEEINCPSLQEIAFMVDGGYTVDEILKAERFMLSMLSFELGWPGPMSFLRRISKADEYDLETRTLAKYFLEVSIMDERFVSTPPSFLAAATHCLSRLMLKKGDWVSCQLRYVEYHRKVH